MKQKEGYRFTTQKETEAQKDSVTRQWFPSMLVAKPEPVTQSLGLPVLFPLCTITKMSSFQLGWRRRWQESALCCRSTQELSGGTPCRLQRAERNNSLHLSVPIHLPIPL